MLFSNIISRFVFQSSLCNTFLFCKLNEKWFCQIVWKANKLFRNAIFFTQKNITNYEQNATKNKFKCLNCNVRVLYLQLKLPSLGIRYFSQSSCCKVAKPVLLKNRVGWIYIKVFKTRMVKVISTVSLIIQRDERCQLEKVVLNSSLSFQQRF